MSSAANTKNYFVNNLLQLQNKIKRDSSSYKDEFTQTFHNYESNLKVYLMKPTKQNKQVADLASFLAHVSHCYPEELKSYPQQLLDILKKYSTLLNPEMRLAFCKCLMLIRGKGLIEPIPLFQAFFALIKCPDKLLRKTLYTHMLNDAKKIKTKQRNFKLCSQVQQYVFTLTTKDNHPMTAKYALNLLMDLYKKQVWNDAKTVNVIANACFCKITKVVALALQFFAGRDTETSSDDESDSDHEDKQTAQQILMRLRVGKKTNKSQKRTQRALKAVKKEKKSKKTNNGIPCFSALNLIYDPQDFAEKLFKLVETTNEAFEIKIAILDLISRLVGIHSLYLSNFHPFLIRFLNPHQREVTKMLWFASISSHELTPPDTVEPLLMSIANNFITERNNSEVIAVGLNSIREICSRCPLAMNEDLLGDLIQYKTYKDKGVSYAAKSLIQLFREKNPQLLQKKLRGKPTEASYIESIKVRQYGEIDAKSFIPGAEIIAIEHENAKNLGEEEDEEEDEEENEWVETDNDDSDLEEEKSNEKKNRSKKRKHSDDDDDDDGWVDVSSDEDDDDLIGQEDSSENAQVSLLTLEEKEEKAKQISTEKIFTQEDFKNIRLEQLKKKVTDKNFVKGAKKRKVISIGDDDEDEENEKATRDGLVPLSAITSINKKKKQDKEARMANIMEGRKDRGKFGQRIKDSKLGKSNKEKRKTKSYMMIKHKANKKQKRSYNDKQRALKTSLLKQKRFK